MHTHTDYIHVYNTEKPGTEETDPPVHVAGLWADSGLASVDAGVVYDRRDVLVPVPNLGGSVERRHHDLSNPFEERPDSRPK